MAQQQFVRTEVRNGVFLVTLSDPKTRNALGPEMTQQLSEALDRFETDPTLRVLVLTGEDPAFCSGANVRGMQQTIDQRQQEAPTPTYPTPWELLERRYSPKARRREAVGEGARYMPLRIWDLPKPSIAAVNGFAYGVGAGLAWSCDIRIASERAEFAEAFIRVGLVPADGSCWQLPRLIGLSNTLLMQYTGDAVKAEEALRWGLVSKVVPHERLLEETMALAERLARGPTFSMGLIKYLVHQGLTSDFRTHLEWAGVAQDLARETEDHKEGVRAFLEKRRPVFKGR
ncbi:MAG: enoyl-CoA hydratase-related protein [Dehalococcoidia bacterium]|nr:enoyl-CoA hydratase-related protein [Dehalococcoidia bacterium]MDW8119696.1 enoyl-CoA hydratase-related protein [Chloroflexota bacterium]